MYCYIVHKGNPYGLENYLGDLCAVYIDLILAAIGTRLFQTLRFV